MRAQGELELLVIDSGSRDGSLEIARELADEVIEIAPGEFGHGRTRNLGAERTSGELICFLTQDAIPVSPAGSRPTARPSRSTRASAPPSARICPTPTRAR